MLLAHLGVSTSGEALNVITEIIRRFWNMSNKHLDCVIRGDGAVTSFTRPPF